jgi:acetyl esterase/lipase
MPYEIDKTGRVLLGGRWVAPPSSISAEAQAFLTLPPWGDAPPAGEPRPMWALRETTDQKMSALNEFAQRLFPVEIEETRIAGVRCHVVRPRETPAENQGKALINLHGGGFVLGSGSLVEAIPIAHQAKIPVVAVDYRLAPEHPYPAAVDDAVAVYRAMLQDHAPGTLGIYGASAGGFLTAQTIVRLARDGLPPPACCGVFTAGGDFSAFGDTAQIFTLLGFWGETILPFDHPMSEVKAYLGGADPADPLVSPLRGDLSGFPPTLLMTGTRDALLSATTDLHRALRCAGVVADLFVYDAMPHAHWYMLQLPEAREAIDFMTAFFASHLRQRKD